MIFHAVHAQTITIKIANDAANVSMHARFYLGVQTLPTSFRAEDNVLVKLSECVSHGEESSLPVTTVASNILWHAP